MHSLGIFAIVGLVIAGIIAIVVWSIVLIEYRRILRQRRIDRLIDRIIERAEDSGNESDGDHEALMEMGYDAPWNVDDL
uniref:Protein Vpu n=1 Tax=Human immunodeficiency virus type 1 TaxID=11676 RepID=A0A159C9U4_HV1|nr:vpu protein [Human immunodeficiency virus 1]